MIARQYGQLPKAVAHTTQTFRETTHTNYKLQIAIWNSVGVVVTGIAWPLAIAAIAYLLKAELAALLGRIRSLKALGVEASLDAQIQHSLQPVPQADGEPAIIQPGDELVSSELSSVESVLASWLDVDKALSRAIALPFSPHSKPSSIRSLVKSLAENPKTPTGLPQLILELYSIKNRISRGLDESISDESLNLYRANAIRAAKELQNIAGSQGGQSN